MMATQQHRISAGALVEQDGRVLLVRHVKPNVYDFWVAPGGGVQGQETLDRAAQREVREETGILVAPQRMAYIEELHNPEMRHCKFWYAAHAIGGELSVAAPQASAEFIVEAAWLSMAEIEGKLVFPLIISGRYWSDRLAGFPSVVHLGLRQMTFW